MIKNNVLGILFPNAHDNLMSEMTELRSMGSVPFCGRYRVIDFALSNLVNAGIGKVGIVTKSHYQSLMDHIGSGKPWDLDRKSGGLFFLSPYSNSNATFFTGHIDGLYGAMSFLKQSTEDYAVLCDSDVVTNFDLNDMIEKHIASGADITIAYKKGKMPKNHSDIMMFGLEGDRITEITFPEDEPKCCNFSLDITILSRNKLIELVKYGHERNLTSLSRGVFQSRCKELDMRGYEVKDYAAVIDCAESYASITNEILSDPAIRGELFDRSRPVFTKTRDDMPTKYGLKSDVKNCIIADGCLIEGTVKNSVLFRGVKIGAGAIVENCIVMQDSEVGDGAEIQYVTLDKEVRVGAGKTLKGTEVYPIYIRKNAEV